MNYFKLIEQRMSTRDFAPDAVSVDDLNALERYFDGCMRLDPTLAVDLVLAPAAGAEFAGAAGYQGFAIAAPYYAVLLSEDSAHLAENAGFIGADLLLKMTELGLGHCWITFMDGEAVKDALGIDSEKQVAALIAFGVARRDSRAVRLDIKSPSQVSVTRREGHVAPKVPLDEFVFDRVWGEPLYVSDMAEEEDLKQAFIAASLSPSYLNRQPYRLVYEPGLLTLVQMPDELTGDYDARLGLGIVMQHVSCVLEQTRSQSPRWTLGDPGRDLGLPPGCRAAAYCKA